MARVWVRIFFCIRSSPASTSTRIPRAAQRGHDPAHVRQLLVGDRDGDHLHRGQPRRERAGVVLGEHAEEPLDGAEQRPVDHDRALPGAVRRGVLQVERSGSIRSTWMVDICQVRPIASLACTLIFGA